MNKALKVVLLGVLLVISFSVVSFAGNGMKIDVGEKAPDFKLKDFVTGKEISLSDYKGKKIVLIQFWATWCAICKREIPYLVNLYNKKNDDFEVLAVALSSGENDKKQITELIAKYKIPYPILMDTDGKVANTLYELAGPIPVIAVIDKEGKVNFELVGEIPPEDDPLPYVFEDLRGGNANK